MFVKQIFICWLQGFDNAPYIVKLCLLSWKIRNPTWKIIELDYTNIYDYVNKDYFETIKQTKQIAHCHFTDILRLHLLKNHSGVWADATTYCTRSLDSWIFDYINQRSFFVFTSPGGGRLLSNWFIVSTNDSQLLNLWLDGVTDYWNKNNSVNNYFLHHNIFKNLYNTNPLFKALWDSCKGLPAGPAHFFQSVQSNAIDDFLLLSKNQSPVQKLSYKKNISPVRSIVDYLLSSILESEMTPNDIILQALNIINTDLLPIVNSIKEPLEGNLFFRHHTQKYTDDFKEKRENLVIQSQKPGVKNALEVGFNAGFSTLLILLSNPNIHITCVDICVHKYTIPCKDKLSQLFPGRITFYKGSSPLVLKTLNDKYDLIHIDGCHRKDIAKQDLDLSVSKCNPNCIVVMDDTHVPDLMTVWNETCKKYNLQPVNDCIPSKYHQIAQFKA